MAIVDSFAGLIYSDFDCIKVIVLKCDGNCQNLKSLVILNFPYQFLVCLYKLDLLLTFKHWAFFIGRFRRSSP